MADDVHAAEAKTYHGHCTCGDVQFSVKGLSDIWYCHCRQCRNMTGHIVAGAGALRDSYRIQGEVKWYYITEKASHGFCPRCGSQLFWQHDDWQHMSVLAGALDDTEGLAVKGHIFAAEKGDYYELDGEPCQLPVYATNVPGGTR